VKLARDDLPPQLTELCDLIGLPATLKLVEHLGGSCIDVPSRFRDDFVLVPLVGHKTAARVVSYYAGDRLYIAKADQALRAQRNIEISRRYEGGASVFALAREYHLTMRQVQNILKRPETLRESPQQSLFE
jgi:hypothetical protein